MILALHRQQHRYLDSDTIASRLECTNHSNAAGCEQIQCLQHIDKYSYYVNSLRTNKPSNALAYILYFCYISKY